MPNHIAPTDNIVVNGMAPLECFPHIKRLIKNPMLKTIPGYSVDVRKAAACV